ncbi:MAG: hypothetical protein HUJ61_07780 [Bacilli bacterium]|nr:hypothetical protein [Bacilli bacterium]
MEEKFKNYLSCNKEDIVLALTDRSYRSVQSQQDLPINNDYATIGDAYLKFILSEMLIDKKIAKLSEEKQRYESDAALVNIAKHYKVLDKLKYNEEQKVKDYDYKSSPKKHKFIATAMEALLYAIYLINKDDAKEVVYEWVDIIDKERK